MILGAHMANDGVIRLQNALNALGQVKGDQQLRVAVDGIVGPATVHATNRALISYIVQGAGRAPRWRNVTSDTIKNSAADIAVAIEQAAGVGPAVPSSPPPAAGPSKAAQVASFFQIPQEQTMFPQQPGYYPPQQPYYPPQGYAPGSYPYARAPGGLPANQASLDVKAFIPAQYDHVRLTPASGMAILAAGIIAVMLISQHKKAKA